MKTFLPSSSISLSAAPVNESGVGEFLRELHRLNPVLSAAGWAHVALAALAVLLLALDHRTVTELNVWIKPLKFALSIVVYAWTLGWLLAALPAAAQGAVRLISWGVALSMGAEIVVIFLQAARGTTSHYNVSSALDGALFGIMGLFIFLNTALLIWTLVLASRYELAGPAAYAWGIRLGLLLFLVGSAVGGVMIRHLGHTIGAADGGPGLPGLGWSTRAGDLRAAHFLGLHALQALPLAGWLLTRWLPAWSGRGQVFGLLAFALLYAGAVAWLYGHAMQGLPLWRVR
ncbi:hypothetical protein [Hymenobacter persicinus]|uniref:Uncharacterized protein n=1 Tax=Hymenobacter persicinus TaxID=2025506 RepID=A0A4Q5L6T3_9BACT|nr:hypothetical protein [Hymenobacter persicinus]RYU75833.1 hypothetical protein EWM57_19400 [Hymenobacter persicinus]